MANRFEDPEVQKAGCGGLVAGLILGGGLGLGFGLIFLTVAQAFGVGIVGATLGSLGLSYLAALLEVRRIARE